MNEADGNGKRQMIRWMGSLLFSCLLASCASVPRVEIPVGENSAAHYLDKTYLEGRSLSLIEGNWHGVSQYSLKEANPIDWGEADAGDFQYDLVIFHRTDQKPDDYEFIGVMATEQDTFALDRLVVGDVLLELNSTAEAGVYEGHCFCGGPLSVSQNRDLKVDLRENPSTIKLPGLPTYVHTLIRVDPEGLKPPR